jgi:hypothetical protein
MANQPHPKWGTLRLPKAQDGRISIDCTSVYRPTDFHPPFSGDANPYSRWELTAQPVDLSDALNAPTTGIVDDVD